MLIGVLAGLTTCALWGLTFVAPRAVVPFSAVDLTIARYVTFGVLSTCLMVHQRFRPTSISKPHIAIGLLLGGCGYVGYFIAVANAVELAGASLPPVVIGTMPVLLALIANRGGQRMPWRHLLAPLGSIALGIIIVNFDALGSAGTGRQDEVALGLLSACAALVLWVAYGVVNSIVMRTDNPPDALHWTGLQGVGAALGSLLLLPFASFGVGQELSRAIVLNFVLWALLMGIAGSWLATWCWTIAARRLPLALAAQLIVAETVFGLLFGFLFEERWPSPAEWAGCAFQIVGVAAAITVFVRTTAPAPGPLFIPNCLPSAEGFGGEENTSFVSRIDGPLSGDGGVAVNVLNWSRAPQSSQFKFQTDQPPALPFALLARRLWIDVGAHSSRRVCARSARASHAKTS